MNSVGGAMLPLVDTTTAVMDPVMLVRGFFQGIVLILAIVCAFNGMRGWYRYHRNRLDYSLGGALVNLAMSGVMGVLFLIDQLVGFESMI